MKIKISLLFILITTLTYGQNYSELKLDSTFKDNTGTFVLYELNKDKYHVYNSKRADQAFPVHSTSKILWSIIGMEEGIISPNAVMKWDSIKHPHNKYQPIEWARDHSIVSALKYSVNWYYIELMKSMTPRMIEEYLIKFDYRFEFKVDRVHYYGITFNIKKSALEQIDFLKNIYLNNYDLSKNTLSVVDSGMLFQESEELKLFTRTGLGPSLNDTGIGWLIGFVEKEKETYFFAFNVEGADEMEALKLRNKLSYKILKALELIK